MNIDPSPFGATAAEAAAVIRGQIAGALPPGWQVAGLDERNYLGGRIHHVRDSGGDYGVIVPASLDLLVFTYGNSSPGIGSFGVERALEHAFVIAPMLVRAFGMKAVVTRLLEFPTNRYDLT